MTVPAWPERGDRDYVEKTADVIAGIQSGTAPIALAGIEAALGEWTGWVNLGEYAGVDPTGSADSYTALQAALDSIPEGATGYLPPGTYKTSQTLKTKKHRSLVGSGIGSKILGDNVLGPIILTFDGTLDALEPSQRFRDLAIGGTADCAISFAHCCGTVAERIKLIDFEGVDGFRFEGLWQCEFNSLDASNCNIGRAAFKVNKTCLDSIWRLGYTGGSGRPDFALYVDRLASDDGNMSATSSRELHFDTFTAQAAEVVGIALVNGSQVTLTNPYTEANHIPAQIGNIAQSNWCIQIVGGQLLGGRGAETPFDLVVNALSDLKIIGTRFYDKPLVFGNVVQDLAFVGVAGKLSTSLLSLMERTVDSGANLPLQMIGDTEAVASITLQATGGGYKMQKMTVDGTGAWAATPTTIPLSGWRGVKSISASGLTATLETYIAHGYTTGDSVKIECASPKVFNGTYTITVTDATHFTYTIASTPRESPAIGQPMVKKL